MAVARGESVQNFGAFAVAFSIYILVTGLSRTSITDSHLALPQSQDLLKRSAGQISLIAAVPAAITILAGLVLRSEYIVVIGFSLHGLALYDYVKTVSIGVGNPVRALAQESIWTLLTSGAVISALVGLISPIATFTVWSLTGALIGYAQLRLLDCSPTPRWGVRQKDTRLAVSFGLEYIAGSGTAQFTTLMLGGAVGTAILGALRGAGTVFGPVTLVIGTIRSLLIPHLSRARNARGVNEGYVAVKTTSQMLLFVIPVAIAVTFIPKPLGQTLLGASWQFAEPVLPMIAAELIFATSATSALAGHRAHFAGRRTLTLRAILAPVRMSSVVGSGITFGASGAALAMAAMALLESVVWWTSYLLLIVRATRRARPDGAQEI